MFYFYFYFFYLNPDHLEESWSQLMEEEEEKLPQESNALNPIFVTTLREDVRRSNNKM